MGSPPSEDELKREAHPLRVYTIELRLRSPARLWEVLVPSGWRLIKAPDGALSLETTHGVSRADAWQLCHQLIKQLGSDELEAYPSSQTAKPHDEAVMSAGRTIDPKALDAALRAALNTPLHTTLGFVGSSRDDKAPEEIDLGWHLETIGLSDALYKEAAGWTHPLIGHLDTGYSFHKELDGVYTGNLLPQHRAQFRAGGSPAHGTHTASVLASRARGGPRDILGVARHAQLYPVRVHRCVILAPWNMDELAEGINEAVKAGCEVISISMGGLFGRRALREAVEAAIEKGVIIVAAAGQLLDTMDARWLPGGVTVPGSYDDVITAAACEGVLVQEDGKPSYTLRIAPWSARGPEVDIIAPGWPIAIASWEDGHEGKDDRITVKQSWGTSYATAQTAGVAALWLAKHHEALKAYPCSERPRMFKQALSACRGAGVEGWNNDEWGVGLLNAEAILAAPLSGASSASRGGHVPIAAKLTDAPLDRLLDRMWTQISRRSKGKLAVGEARERLESILTSRGLWRADLSPDMALEALDRVLRDDWLRKELPELIISASGDVNKVRISPGRFGVGIMSAGEPAEPNTPALFPEASRALSEALAQTTQKDNP